MAIQKIDDFDLYYDSEIDILFDKNNKICSNIPNGTFAFNSKIYTYGTIVKIQENFNNFYIAKFTQNLELNDIFKGIDLPSKQYTLNKNELEPCYIKEIIKPIYYKSTHTQPTIIETPPIEKGYIISTHKSEFQKITEYKDYLRNCDIDNQNQVLVCYNQNTFGYKDKVYTTNTRVIFEINIDTNIKYCIATFINNKFISNGYPNVNIDLSPYYVSRISKQNKFNIIYILEPHYYNPK